MQVESYRHGGGIHWETGALANILAAVGLRDPRTGRPLPEWMLLGIGGGISGGYLLYEMFGGVWVVTGYRASWQKYKGEFSEAVCARLGVPVEPAEAGGQKQSEASLVRALEAGRPVWAVTSEAALAHRGLPEELAKWTIYGVVVYGQEGDDYLVDDLRPEPVRVPRAELALARSVIPYNKNRMLAFGPATGPPDLAAAARAGLRQGVEELLHPPIKNFGVTAWEKWSKLLTHPKDKKGWPTVMAGAGRLESALRWAYCGMLKECGPGGHRDHMAAFLNEATVLLDLPALETVAASYSRLAGQWRAFHDALLPDSVPALAELRRVCDARDQLLRTGGAGAAVKVRALWLRLEELGATAIEPAARAALLPELAARMGEIAVAEREAALALQAAIV